MWRPVVEAHRGRWVVWAWAVVGGDMSLPAGADHFVAVPPSLQTTVCIWWWSCLGSGDIGKRLKVSSMPAGFGFGFIPAEGN